MKVIRLLCTFLTLLWKVPVCVVLVSVLYLCSLCFWQRSFQGSFFFFFVTYDLVSHLMSSSSRSIWICAHQQNSIPPVSRTLAARALLATTRCFLTTRYRTSPVSPNTSTSTGTSKHEPQTTNTPTRPAQSLLLKTLHPTPSPLFPLPLWS